MTDEDIVFKGTPEDIETIKSVSELSKIITITHIDELTFPRTFQLALAFETTVFRGMDPLRFFLLGKLFVLKQSVIPLH